MYTSRSNSDMCFVDRDKSLTDIDVEIVDGAVRNRVNRYNRGITTLWCREPRISTHTRAGEILLSDVLAVEGEYVNFHFLCKFALSSKLCQR